jgi:hypothetical protein
MARGEPSSLPCASTTPTNTVLSNQATIAFDNNAPISTNVWSNVVDRTPPSTHVSPLASVEPEQTFTVNWTGPDVGSGVKSFTIYVSDNGGPFTVFQSDTTATSGSFTGQTGHSYGFYSVAQDLVHNFEASKAAAEATTQVGVSFGTLTARAEISRAGFGSFTPVNSSDIQPSSQAVTLVFGTFSATVPAGAFNRNKKGVYSFEGKINGVRLDFTITPIGSAFTFEAETNGVNLQGVPSPISLTLLIGTTGGTTTVKTK